MYFKTAFVNKKDVQLVFCVEWLWGIGMKRKLFNAD